MKAPWARPEPSFAERVADRRLALFVVALAAVTVALGLSRRRRSSGGPTVEIGTEPIAQPYGSTTPGPS